MFPLRKGLKSCHCFAIEVLGELQEDAAGIFKLLGDFHAVRNGSAGGGTEASEGATL